MSFSVAFVFVTRIIRLFAFEQNEVRKIFIFFCLLQIFLVLLGGFLN